MTLSLPSRGLRGYAGSVLAGAISAALFAVALMHAGTAYVMLAYLSAVPLFVAGLGGGLVSGALAAVVAVVGLGATRPLDFALFFAVVYALPVAALNALALYPAKGDSKPTRYSEGSILTAITLYPCVLFLMAALIGSHFGGLLQLTQHIMAGAIDQIKSAMDMDADTLANFSAAMNQLARLLPALLGCSWMFVMLLSMYVAQSTLKQQNWNLRPDFAIQDIFVPNWLIFAAAITGLAGTFAPAPYNYIGVNLCTMLCIPFFFVGLAVVHALAGMSKARIWILVAFYIVMSLVVWTMLLVTALGVADQWVNFRRRFAGVKRGG